MIQSSGVCVRTGFYINGKCQNLNKNWNKKLNVIKNYRNSFPLVLNYSRLCDSYIYFIPKLKKSMHWEKSVRALMISINRGFFKWPIAKVHNFPTLLDKLLWSSFTHKMVQLSAKVIIPKTSRSFCDVHHATRSVTSIVGFSTAPSDKIGDCCICPFINSSRREP